MTSNGNSQSAKEHKSMKTAPTVIDKTLVSPDATSETATYIKEMLEELCTMADRANMPFLAYLLNLTGREAASQGHRRS